MEWILHMLQTPPNQGTNVQIATSATPFSPGDVFVFFFKRVFFWHYITCFCSLLTMFGWWKKLHLFGSFLPPRTSFGHLGTLESKWIQMECNYGWALKPFGYKNWIIVTTAHHLKSVKKRWCFQLPSDIRTLGYYRIHQKFAIFSRHGAHGSKKLAPALMWGANKSNQTGDHWGIAPGYFEGENDGKMMGKWWWFMIFNIFQ